MNILCLVSSQSRRKPGFSNSRRNPISKDRIPEKKIVDTKKTELLYLAMDVVLLESFDQDATLATQFDKKMMPCHQV
ncbi:hypothetical protein TNCV_762041 [Trichonephila clavipes]|nr:hypothetical protein TNCV_762041 [Trichonephila clavipes]